MSSLTGRPQLPQAEIVSNDGFWPDLQVGDLINQYRIPAEYEPDVIQNGLTMAALRVNRRLAEVKDALIEDYLQFDEFAVTGDTFNGSPSLIKHYYNAVYCIAKSYLLQQFNSLNRRPNAESAAKESYEMETYWLDQAEISLAEIIRAVLPESVPVSDYGVVVDLL